MAVISPASTCPRALAVISPASTCPRALDPDHESGPIALPDFGSSPPLATPPGPRIESGTGRLGPRGTRSP